MQPQTLREYHLQKLSDKERECVQILESLGLDTCLQAEWFTEFVSHKTDFEQANGRSPTIEEFARLLGIGRDRTKNIVRGYYVQVTRHNIQSAQRADQLGLDDEFREYWGLIQSGGDLQYLAREADKQRRRGGDGGRTAGNRGRDAELVRIAEEERERRQLRDLPAPTFADIAAKYNKEFGDRLTGEAARKAINRYRKCHGN